MAYLELKNINKYYGSRQVLKNINLTVDKGSFVSLLGESGSGKTTLLRIIAGLETLHDGQIILDGKDITDLSVEKRGISLVFQNYALFPHMDVFNNIAYGLKLQKQTPATIHKKVSEVLEKVNLSGRDKYSVSSLSGGEQQRVALARAIITEPKILLLDEPLSNLDYHLRLQARNELKRLQHEIGVSSIFVTHDQSEALALSDKIAVLNNSVIMQTGDPREVYEAPANIFTASFVGRYNMFSKAEALSLFDNTISDTSILAVLPEHLYFDNISSGKWNAIIKDILFTGSLTEYVLTVNKKDFKAVAITNGCQDFEIGNKVLLSIHKNNYKIIPV